MKDNILVCLTLMVSIVLGIVLLMLIPDIHAGIVLLGQEINTALIITFVAGITLGSTAAAVKIWQSTQVHVARDGKDGQVARAIAYRGQIIQIGSAEGLGINELIQMQGQLIGQQHKSIQVIEANAKALQRIVPLLGEYEEEDEEEEVEVLQIETPNSDDEYIHLSDSHKPHADDFLSSRKLICGVSGSGKSNSVATFCEELGRLNVPMILADTENEYGPLGDKRWLPNGKLVDSASLNPDSAIYFGRYILENNIQAIVNLQSYDMEEAAWVMVNLIQGLNQWQEERANDSRIPCEFLLEEATTWLPQNVRESALNDTEVMPRLQSAFFNDLVRKGRKRGLGLTIICQKIAEIDKRALQCDLKLLHRQTELNDLERYRKMGITNEETLCLQQGEGYFFSPKASKMLIQVRKRHSDHGANTPDLKALRSHQKSVQLFSSVDKGGNKFLAGNTFGNTLETASGLDLDAASGLLPGEHESTATHGEKVVSIEKRETIKRLVDMGMPHRDTARAVGLSGRNYRIYQQVCKEEGIVPHESTTEGRI